MVIVMTGATGLLGRNILFEYLKESRDSLDTLTVFILGRSRPGKPLRERARNMVLTDGLAYLSADNAAAGRVQRFCETGLRCVGASLERPGLGIAAADLAAMRERPVDLFFHAAALTDLRSGEAVARALQRVNVQGTAETLRLASALPLREFCYISTAYACGKKAGLIAPDHLDPEADFRNPYERSKARAELLVREYASRTGTRCRFFRPTVLCGRLMENPRGAVAKFEAFYAWAAFFYAMKLRAVRSRADRYTQAVELPMRLCYDPGGTLNIIPADYAAKAICRICAGNDPESHFHLANPAGTPHPLYIRASLEALAVSAVRQVDAVPSDPTPLERLYYRTVGAMFTPYVTGSAPRFDTTATDRIMRGHGLACPPVDETNFPALLEYAKRFDFGRGRAARAANGL